MAGMTTGRTATFSYSLPLVATGCTRSHTQDTTTINDNRPLRHSRASPYIGCMRRFHEYPRRSRLRGNDASLSFCMISSPSGDLCITHRGGSRSPSNGGVQRGDAPLPGVWGCPPQAYRAGGWEELRPPSAVTQRSPLGEGQGEGSGDRKCNQMQLNATKLKVSRACALLTRPTKAGWPSAYE